MRTKHSLTYPRLPIDDAQVERTNSFAAGLKALRLRSGLSQRELAKAANVSANSIASWELTRRLPRDASAIERLGHALQATSPELDQLLLAGGLPPHPRGLATRIEDVRLRISDTAGWLARYPWVCLIANDRHELLAWNRPANLVAEIDLATVLPTPEQRNILWMAVLPHFRDVRLTNWDELISGLISVMKAGEMRGDVPPPLWLSTLLGTILAEYPEAFQRIIALFQATPTWRDGARNYHYVAWHVGPPEGGHDLAFNLVFRAWSNYDGTFAMDWHPADSATWAWLEVQPGTGPEATVSVEPSRPWNELLEDRRKALHISRPKLAELSGVPAPTIYAYERNRRRPSREAAIQIGVGLSLAGDTMNEILEQLGHRTMPSDFASWVAGEPRAKPTTILHTSMRPSGESEAQIQEELDMMAWPVLVLGESCEIILGNGPARKLIDWSAWPSLPGRRGPHLLQVILSEKFRERCPNWDDVVRDIVPVELEPLALGRDATRTRSSLIDLVRHLRRTSRETLDALVAAWDAQQHEDSPRVVTTVEWQLENGQPLRFHVVVDQWNSFDPYWAVDMHPADSATWRWFGR